MKKYPGNWLDKFKHHYKWLITLVTADVLQMINALLYMYKSLVLCW